MNNWSKDNMGLKLKSVISCTNLIFKKLRYGKKLSFSLPVAITKVHFEIGKGSSVSIGKKVQNRGPLYLISDKGGSLAIGSNCFFNVNSSITCLESITIGNNCKFGNNLVIVDHDHNFKKQGDEEFIKKPVTIGSNVWVGANVTILKGVTIGDNAVIGAGSLVTRDVASNEKYIDKRGRS